MRSFLLLLALVASVLCSPTKNKITRKDIETLPKVPRGRVLKHIREMVKDTITDVEAALEKKENVSEIMEKVKDFPRLDFAGASEAAKKTKGLYEQGIRDCETTRKTLIEFESPDTAERIINRLKILDSYQEEYQFYKDLYIRRYDYQVACEFGDLDENKRRAFELILVVDKAHDKIRPRGTNETIWLKKMDNFISRFLLE